MRLERPGQNGGGDLDPLKYLWAFLIGGLICLLAQIVLDNSKLSPGHVLSGLTAAGGILGGLGLYQKLVLFAGAGASMPISNFGSLLARGAMVEARTDGLIGVLTGMFEFTSAGVTAAIVFAFLVALLFQPKS